MAGRPVTLALVGMDHFLKLTNSIILNEQQNRPGGPTNFLILTTLELGAHVKKLNRVQSQDYDSRRFVSAQSLVCTIP